MHCAAQTVVPWQLLQSAMEATKGRRVAEHAKSRAGTKALISTAFSRRSWIPPDCCSETDIVAGRSQCDYARGEGTARMQFLSLPG